MLCDVQYNAMGTDRSIGFKLTSSQVVKAIEIINCKVKNFNSPSKKSPGHGSETHSSNILAIIVRIALMRR